MSSDFSCVLIEGDWEHSFVAANGNRFHVVSAGPASGPLMVFLHGFPQFWWAWRNQLPVFAELGWRVVAVDLRGTGASDKPPRGYDLPALSRDIAGIVRSLGQREAVFVGSGVGGWLAWSMAHLQPSVTRAIAVLGMPHPGQLHVPLQSSLTQVGRATFAKLQLAKLVERDLQDPAKVRQMFNRWAGALPLAADVVDTYLRALQIPSVARTSHIPLRWVSRVALPHSMGRRYLQAVRSATQVPVLHLQGRQDAVFKVSKADIDAAALAHDYRFEVLGDAGHFLAEQSPEEVNSALADWLAKAL